MKNIILLLSIAILTLTSCENKEKTDKNSSKKTEINKEAHEHNDMGVKNTDTHSHDHSKTETKSPNIKKSTKESKVKNPATTPIINAYLQIKNALVVSDKLLTAKGAKVLLKAFDSFDMSKLSGTTHKEYMEIVENSKEQATHIIKNPLDHQREHFEVLSADIIDLVALLGTDKTLYVYFCSKVNDDEGAIWLSEKKEIKNPYLGEKEDDCATLRKQIN